MDGHNVEVIIDWGTEYRRYRLRGIMITFFAMLLTTTAVFATAAISVNNLCSETKRIQNIANESSDKYQDIRLTFVGGITTKEYLSVEDLKKEDEIIASIKAREKALEEEKKREEQRKLEEKKKAEEQKKAASAKKAYVPPAGSKIVYLTFDDGPGPYTGKLLDILKKYNVKATFFVTCNRTQYRNMISRAYAEGHAIGLHSCSHDYASVYKNESAFFKELNDISNVVKSATGVETKLVRFPGGSSNTVSRKYNKGIMTRLAKQLVERGYTYFDWNISSGDAGNTKNTNVVYNNVVYKLRGDYSIVLQHDIKDFSVNAVERIIQFGLKNGFKFRKLEMNSPTARHRINN